MYNYLGLVNDVNEKMNEVPLTSGTFTSASGYYSEVKNAVNRAIDKINLEQYEWPFNRVVKDLTLVVNQSRYDFEVDCKTLNMKSFRIINDKNLIYKTQFLSPLDYEVYIEKYSDMENQPEDYAAIPTNVFKTTGLEFGIAPAPDKAYLLRYEYYKLPLPLELYTDVPSIPEIYRSVIFDGAMHYVHRFKGDIDNAQISLSLFNEGIARMRSIYINRAEYVRSTVRG